MIPLAHADNKLRSFPIITVILIAINCLVFVWEMGHGLEQMTDAYGCVPYEITHGVDIGEPGPGFIYLTLITSLFLHGNFMHLGGNLVFLWVFGATVEDRLGKYWYLGLYFLSGLMASFGQIYLTANGPDWEYPGVGASGAIAGVQGAFLLLFPLARIKVFWMFGLFGGVSEISAWLAIGFWYLTQIISGAGEWGGEQLDSVAYGAHIGGFVGGLVLVKLMLSTTHKSMLFDRTIMSQSYFELIGSNKKQDTRNLVIWTVAGLFSFIIFYSLTLPRPNNTNPLCAFLPALCQKPPEERPTNPEEPARDDTAVIQTQTQPIPEQSQSSRAQAEIQGLYEAQSKALRDRDLEALFANASLNFVVECSNGTFISRDELLDSWKKAFDEGQVIDRQTAIESLALEEGGTAKVTVSMVDTDVEQNSSGERATRRFRTFDTWRHVGSSWYHEKAQILSDR